jgi:hypothetical protein
MAWVKTVCPHCGGGMVQNDEARAYGHSLPTCPMWDAFLERGQRELGAEVRTLLPDGLGRLVARTPALT